MNERNSNDLCTIIAQAISEMEAEQGKSLSVNEINLAELERCTGITRARLRRLKNNNFKPAPHGRTGQHAEITVLSDFTGALDNRIEDCKPPTASGDFREAGENGIPGQKANNKNLNAFLKELEDIEINIST